MPNADNTGPGYPEGYQPATGALSTIIDNSVATGFRKWGFVILRGVYDNNDDEWETFLNLYKAAVADELHDYGLQDELGPHLEWTVIEDRHALEGASKAAVRARFLAWVAEQQRQGGDGELAGRRWVAQRLPRYKYCLYVDEVCLRSITARLERQRRQQQQELYLSSIMGCVVIINGLHPDPESEEDEEEEEEEEEDDEDDDEEDEGWSKIDGTTNYDVGWAYIDVLGYAELYDNLSSYGSVWDGMVYRGRRPEFAPEPDYDHGRPLSEVPRGVPYGQHMLQQ